MDQKTLPVCSPEGLVGWMVDRALDLGLQHHFVMVLSNSCGPKSTPGFLVEDAICLLSLNRVVHSSKMY
jgi:hypothetical protein